MLLIIFRNKGCGYGDVYGIGWLEEMRMGLGS